MNKKTISMFMVSVLLMSALLIMLIPSQVYASSNNTNAVTATDNLTGTVTASSLKVRSGPGTSYSTLGSLKKNATVTVTKKDYSKGWHQVSYSGKTGYVSASYIKITASTTPQQPDPGTTNSGTGDNFTGTVTASSLNVRSGPGTSYSTLGSLKKNATVTVTKKDYSKGWHQVSYNGKTGYVSASYIKITASTTPQQPDPGTTNPAPTNPGTGDNLTGTVTASSLKVRSGPGTSYSTLGSLKKNATVTVTKKDYAKGWHQINYSGKTGYVSADYIKITASTTPQQPDPGTTNPAPTNPAPTNPGTGDNLAGTVTASSLNVRSGPGTSYSTLGSLKNGATITVTKKDYSKGWHQINYNAKAGYVSADFIKFDSGSNNDTSVQVSFSVNAVSLREGQNFRLFSTVSPSTASNKSLTWSTSNAGVATVNSEGRIMGVSAGSAVITATSVANPGATANCTVYVGGQNATLTGYAAPSPQHFQGSSYSIRGTVDSQSPLTSVNLKVLDGSGKAEIDVSTTWTGGTGPKSYPLTGITNSIDSRAKFGTLGLGYREIQISCVNSDGVVISLASSVFEVITPDSSTWYKLTTAQFSSQSTVKNVAKYFEGEDYLFTYKFNKVGERAITIQAPFESKYQKKYDIPGTNLYLWINKNMYDQCNNAFTYANNSKVTIVYKSGDSIVDTKSVWMSELVKRAAAWSSRFQSGLTYISVHSFGVAIDINDNVSVNAQTAANFPKIDKAIKKLSTAQVTDLADGKKEYTFEYQLDSTENPPSGAVPDELVNFMLYQVAFERYGFYWGTYFSSCDAMHFSAVETTVTPAEHVKVTDFSRGVSAARTMLSAPEIIQSGENYDLPLQ